MMVSDYLTFIRELPRSFSEIGAMLPSSPHLGKLMVRPIERDHRPLNILEVGPGTGPFTRQILNRMSPEDRFVICEINSRFMLRLKKSLQDNPDYRANADRVYFFEGPVQELPQSEFFIQFDVIVSSLPFLNFSPAAVESIFSLFEEMLTESGSITFFHYLGLPKIRRILPDKDTRCRVKGVEQVIDHWCDRVAERGIVRRHHSYWNFPPAMSIELAYQNSLKN